MGFAFIVTVQLWVNEHDIGQILVSLLMHSSQHKCQRFKINSSNKVSQWTLWCCTIMVWVHTACVTTNKQFRSECTPYSTAFRSMTFSYCALVPFGASFLKVRGKGKEKKKAHLPKHLICMVSHPPLSFSSPICTFVSYSALSQTEKEEKKGLKKQKQQRTNN